tara:strand:+ start:106 stop:285 length:180 start_codon:yes stop_codon:yes gene_type:complete
MEGTEKQNATYAKLKREFYQVDEPQKSLCVGVWMVRVATFHHPTIGLYYAIQQDGSIHA